MKLLNKVHSSTSALLTKLRAGTRRNVALVWVGVSICSASLVFAAVGHRTAGPRSPAGMEQPPSAVEVTPVRQVANPPEVELVTILPYGFDPPKISRPNGHFIVVMDNRSGLDGLSLTLTAESTPSVVLLSKQLTLSELDGYNSLDLSPGHYALREANHPEWSCVVEIAP